MKTKHFFIIIYLYCVTLSVFAESVTYRITGFNSDAGDFTTLSFGEKPMGSYLFFDNEFGATRGNRYNQIPRNKEAIFWLYGWDGCTINSITLWMCSNNSSGTASLSVKAGEEVLFNMPSRDFCDDAWFGHWVSKDLNTYVEITKEMASHIAVPDGADIAVTIKGGTQEGSVYVDAITIDYEHPKDIQTESSMPWTYEKLEAKSVLNDGDVVMMYRSGDAAGDIDGMEKSHYLDAIGISSTTAVNETFIENFTTNKTSDGHWTLTDQYGRKLGATGAQALDWDNGIMTWDITLGYSGATIANTNTKYGTMRYNAPIESYPRFWNYTSTSLALPYLYRRVKQQEEVVGKEIKLGFEERTVAIGTQDTLIVNYDILPASTTDKRVKWTSSDGNVASVRSGIVFLHNTGTATITATSYNGACTSQCKINIIDDETGIETIETEQPSIRYNMNGTIAKPTTGKNIIIERQGNITKKKLN